VLGIMDELLARSFDMLVGRASGPLHLRLIIQPMMAGLLAIRAGWADAKDGRPAFGWAFLTTPGQRWTLLREAIADVSTLFLVALVLDALYQIVIFHWIYPVQALVVATLLALPTYLLIRGPTNRVLRLWRRRK
jgi:hypothetical protein